MFFALEWENLKRISRKWAKSVLYFEENWRITKNRWFLRKTFKILNRLIVQGSFSSEHHDQSISQREPNASNDFQAIARVFLYFAPTCLKNQVFNFPPKNWEKKSGTYAPDFCLTRIKMGHGCTSFCRLPNSNCLSPTSLRGIQCLRRGVNDCGPRLPNKSTRKWQKTSTIRAYIILRIRSSTSVSRGLPFFNSSNAHQYCSLAHKNWTK